MRRPGRSQREPWLLMLGGGLVATALCAWAWRWLEGTWSWVPLFVLPLNLMIVAVQLWLERRRGRAGYLG